MKLRYQSANKSILHIIVGRQRQAPDPGRQPASRPVLDRSPSGRNSLGHRTQGGGVGRMLNITYVNHCSSSGETVTTRRPFSTTRRSSTGSTISSISSEDTKQKTTSRQSSNNVKQRLSKDTLAKIGNRQIKVVNQEKSNWV